MTAAEANAKLADLRRLDEQALLAKLDDALQRQNASECAARDIARDAQHWAIVATLTRIVLAGRQATPTASDKTSTFLHGC